MFGQVPMLEIDGLYLVQSHTILRYAASRYGWYDSLDAAHIARADMIAEGTSDVRSVGRYARSLKFVGPQSFDIR
jgi:glutathione S-transferase